MLKFGRVIGDRVELTFILIKNKTPDMITGVTMNDIHAAVFVTVFVFAVLIHWLNERMLQPALLS